MFVFPAGSTSIILPLAIKDSASTTGGYKTGLTNTAFAISYSRPDQGNAGATTVTLSGGTKGTYSSGAIVEKDSANAKGLYEFSIPNAALVAGSQFVVITVQDAGSNGIAEQQILIMLADAAKGLAAPTNLDRQLSTLFTTALTESYAALHGVPTLAQLLFEMRAYLVERSVSGTTVTAKKIDGSTTAETFTINDGTSPTAQTRAT